MHNVTSMGINMLSNIIKRGLVGAGFLAGIGASSAVGIQPQAPALTNAFDRLKAVAWGQDAASVPAAADLSDPVWLALVGIALMAVMVKRRSKP